MPDDGGDVFDRPHEGIEIGEEIALNAQRVQISQNFGGELRGPEFDPRPHEQTVQSVVRFGYFRDHAEIRFVRRAVIISGDVGKCPRRKLRGEFTAADVAFDDHLVEARRQKIDHVEIADNLPVFFLGDRSRDENPQMADVFVDDIDNHLSVAFDVIDGFVNPGNPVERLLRRRDIVTFGGENENRAVDVFQAELTPFLQFEFPPFEFVADEKITDDNFLNPGNFLKTLEQIYE